MGPVLDPSVINKQHKHHERRVNDCLTRFMPRIFLVITCLVTVTRSTYGLDLPGFRPIDYCKKGNETEKCKSEVNLFVNRLNSEQSALPYEYSYFDFCESNSTETIVENIGQIVFGERIRPSPYNISFLKNESCKLLCHKSYDMEKPDDIKKLDRLRKGAFENYYHHWIIDDIPVTWCYPVDGDQMYCSLGFPMGCYVDEKGIARPGACLLNPNFNRHDSYYLFNHVHIRITYYTGETYNWAQETWESYTPQGGRITNIKVEPRSINHKSKPNDKSCSNEQEFFAIPGENLGKLDIYYTYSVEFVEDDSIKWSSRWDYILTSHSHANIQWFSILNSLVIVLFLTGMVAMILSRTVDRDIMRYNRFDLDEDAQEEFGWKLVHGDVFRPPQNSMLLSILVGSGTQVFGMALITMYYTILGAMRPENRGMLGGSLLLWFVVCGIAAGYVSARLCKYFGNHRWALNTILTALLCPGIVFILFLSMNLILWAESSSAAVPFDTMLQLIGMWMLVSLPLTFLGAYFGFRRPVWQMPTRTNQIPRQIPEQSIYTQPMSGIIMGGILPFGCIFIQLFFILNSLWSNQVYYMFGFLCIVFIILLITCSETTILLCYFHLCAEDHAWWWRSFLTSGFAAFYLFVYCVHYFMSKMSISGFVSTLLYFGYTLIMVFLFFLLTGTVGFFACLWFVKRIYSSVKVD